MTNRLADDFRLSAFKARMKTLKAYHIHGASKELATMRAFKRINGVSSGGRRELWGWVGKPYEVFVSTALRNEGYEVKVSDIGPAGPAARGSWLHIKW
jgi:hypothetical protein